MLVNSHRNQKRKWTRSEWKQSIKINLQKYNDVAGFAYKLKSQQKLK